MRKKGISTIVASVLLLANFLAACETGGTSSSVNPEAVDVKIWSAPASFKIMRDRDYTDTDEGVLNYEMAKNEIEGAQIILTPQNGYEVGSFTVETADLVGADGAKIEKENVSVYLQKYVRIDTLVNNHGTYGTGYSPDPLLPFDKAVEYGENTVVGKNQGLYVTVETDTETPSGTYSGSLKVTVDGKTYSVPMSVEVWNLAISDAVHAQSLFAVWGNELMNGELDASPEMQQAYYDALLDYRLSGMDLVGIVSNGNFEDHVESFIELAVKATKDERVSAYRIPSSYTEGTGDTFVQNRKTILKEMVYASTEEYCLLDKAAFYYGSTIDEVQFGDRQYLVNPLVESTNQSEELALEELEEEGFFDDLSDEYAAHLKYKLLHMPNLLTSMYDEQYIDGGPTYCPLFDEFNSEDDRDIYTQEKELNGSLWWYGCVGPCSPYPTYHFDDHLLGARVLSWMQYDYGIDGNLYWLVNDIDVNYNRTENMYERVDSTETPGDGTLFYPGVDYGIYGPIGSLRLEMIRDGLEEYEYFYEIEQMANEFGTYYAEEISTREMLQPLFTKLYKGTRYETDNENFYEVRSQIGEIVNRFVGEEKYILKNIEYNGDTATIHFNLVSGYTVTVNGQTVSGTQQGQGMSYSATMKMDQPSNEFKIVVSNGTTQKVITEYAGGKTEIATSFTEATQIEVISGNKDALSSNKENIKITHAAASSWTENTDAAKVEIESTFNPETPLLSMTYFPEVRFNTKALQINTAALTTVRIRVYNDSGIEVKVTFFLNPTNGSRIEYLQTTLKPGWNTINVDTIYKSSSRLAQVDSIVLRFQNTVDNKYEEAMPKQTLYFDELLVSYNEEGNV